MEANQFIVDKWYRNHDGRYGKFSKLSNGNDGKRDYYFHFSELLDKNLNHEYYNGSWWVTDIEKEANMSVIACQLPYTIKESLYQIY